MADTELSEAEQILIKIIKQTESFEEVEEENEEIFLNDPHLTDGGKIPCIPSLALLA